MLVRYPDSREVIKGSHSRVSMSQNPMYICRALGLEARK